MLFLRVSWKYAILSLIVLKRFAEVYKRNGQERPHGNDEKEKR